MGKANLGVLSAQFEDIGIEVAEGRGENQLRVILLDHGLHGFLHGDGLGNALFLHHADVWQLFDLGDGLGVRLVVTIVVT